MAGLQSSNPVFSNAPTLKQTPSVAHIEEMYRRPQRLTMDDVVMRTAMLLGIAVVTGTVAWVADLGFGLLIGAFVAAFVLSLVNTFKREVSPALVIAYAATEGIVLGAISRFYEDAYSGIVVQAAIGTSAVFAGMLFAYRSGAIKVTPRFTKMVVGAGFGLLGLMVVNLLANAFDGSGDGLGLRSGGGLAIVFSLVAIGVAALFLALDFDQAEKLVAAGVDEKESWRIGFGLMVTLVWLYLEILRLLSYFRD